MNLLRSAALLALACGLGSAHAGPTLDAVKKKGYVQCGVSTGIQGFLPWTPRAPGTAWTSTCAAPSRRRCSTTPRATRSRR